jgi:hypothetical protein
MDIKILFVLSPNKCQWEYLKSYYVYTYEEKCHTLHKKILNLFGVEEVDKIGEYTNSLEEAIAWKPDVLFSTDNYAGLLERFPLCLTIYVGHGCIFPSTDYKTLYSLASSPLYDYVIASGEKEKEIYNFLSPETRVLPFGCGKYCNPLKKYEGYEDTVLYAPTSRSFSYKFLIPLVERYGKKFLVVLHPNFKQFNPEQEIIHHPYVTYMEREGVEDYDILNWVYSCEMLLCDPNSCIFWDGMFLNKRVDVCHRREKKLVLERSNFKGEPGGEYYFYNNEKITRDDYLILNGVEKLFLYLLSNI